jgi:hypothetical protein
LLRPMLPCSLDEVPSWFALNVEPAQSALGSR